MASGISENAYCIGLLNIISKAYHSLNNPHSASTDFERKGSKLNKQFEVEWRRSKVCELLVKGYSQYEISKDLQSVA
jgi:hypothetical protein